jgi:hypothetical protein
MHAFLLLGLGACGSGTCFSCLSKPPAPLPESERVYDGLQVKVTPKGFDAGAGRIASALTSIVPRYVSVTIPSTPIKSGALDALLCKNDCTLSVNLSQVSVDRDTPNKLVFTAVASVSGWLSLSGSVSCSAQASAGINVALDVTVATDGLTKHLGGEILAVRAPIQAGDFSITGTGCGTADLAPIAAALAKHAATLEKELKSRAATSAESLLCLACDAYSSGCPAGSTCDAYRCRLPSGSCLYYPQGPFGVAQLNKFTLGIYRESTDFEMHLVAGQKETTVADPLVDPGLAANFRFFGGVVPPAELPACVVPATVQAGQPKRIEMEIEAQKLAGKEPRLASGFHVGAALTESLLTRIVQGLYLSGGFCIEVGPSFTPLLSADTLATILPSIATIADKGAPALITIRAKKPPRMVVGSGEFLADGSGKKSLDKPLVTLAFDTLELSVYSVVAGRTTRLFAVEADSRLPLGIDFAPSATGEAQILPVLGSLEGLAHNVRITSHELLAEDAAALASAVKAMVGLAQPAFASQLPVYQIPPLGGVKLEVLAVRGVSARAAPDEYDAVGIFANIAKGTQAMARVRTRAALLPAEPGTLRPVLEASADLSPAEVQYRVNGGFWSAFRPAGRWAIDDPSLELGGVHSIEIRARRAGAWATLDPDPIRLSFERRPPAQPKARERIAEISQFNDDRKNMDSASTPESTGGCASAPSAPILAVSVAVWALVRKRRIG